MNPSYTFIFGKPADDEVGRWLEGCVAAKAAGYQFTADLIFRYSTAPGWLQNRVSMEVDRDFHPYDFASFVELLSGGRFETVSRVLELNETKDLGAAGANEILDATQRKSFSPDTQSPSLSKELASLEIRLDQIYKQQRLSLAFARVPWGKRS